MIVNASQPQISSILLKLLYKEEKCKQWSQWKYLHALDFQEPIPQEDQIQWEIKSLIWGEMTIIKSKSQGIKAQV